MRCQKSPLWCRLTYCEEFSKIKPSGHMYDTKYIFSAQNKCIMHTPFKFCSLIGDKIKIFILKEAFKVCKDLMTKCWKVSPTLEK